MVSRIVNHWPSFVGFFVGSALLSVAGAAWLLAASAAVFFLSYPAAPLPLVKAIVLAVWIAGQGAMVRAAFLLTLSLSGGSRRTGWTVAAVGGAGSITWLVLVLLNVAWRG